MAMWREYISKTTVLNLVENHRDITLQRSTVNVQSIEKLSPVRHVGNITNVQVKFKE